MKKKEEAFLAKNAPKAKIDQSKPKNEKKDREAFDLDSIKPIQLKW